MSIFETFGKLCKIISIRHPPKITSFSVYLACPLNPFRLRVPVEVPAKNWVKIEISSNCFNIVAKPISSTLITNMDKDFENIVAKVPKMAQKVAQMS